MSLRFGYGAAFAVVSILLVVATMPLIRGEGMPIWDASSFYAPYFGLLGDFARQGELLLWNPWANGGSPDGLDPQVGAFSPFLISMSWLLAGVEWGFRYYWIAIWVLGGLGMILLARHLGAPPWGACIAGISFVTCGFYVGHSQHTSILHAWSALPWVVWRWDVAFVRRIWSPALQAGAIWGLSGLAGYPGMVILNGFFLACWGGVRAIDAMLPGEGAGRRPLPVAARSFGLLAVTLVVGVLVLLPTYLGFLVGSQGYSDRAGVLDRDRAIASNALQPEGLASYATPYVPVLTRLNQRADWVYTAAGCESIYLPVGALALALAVCLGFDRRARFAWLLLAVAIFFLLCSMGRTFPFRGWLYDLLLPFRYFRHSSIFRAHYLFGIVVLAGLASARVEALSGADRQRFWRRMAMVTTPLAIVAIALLQGMPRVLEEVGPLFASAQRWAVGLWLGLLLLTLAGAALPRLARVMPVALLALVLLDGSVALRLPREVIYGTRQAFLGVWQRAADRYVPSLDLLANGEPRIRALKTPQWRNNFGFVSKVPTLENYTPFMNRLHHQWLTSPRLVRTAVGDRRFWFAAEAPLVPADAACLQALARRANHTRRPPLVLHAPELDPARPATESCPELRQLPPAQRLHPNWHVYLPTRLELDVEAPEAGWFLVTDRYARGWRARVNGEEVPIHRANFLFRAVPVPQGASRVEMWYRPFGFPALLLVSWSVLFLALMAPVLGRHLSVRRDGEWNVAR